MADLQAAKVQAASTVIAVEANGLKFEVCEALPKAGASERLALCLHGFPEHAISWRYQMPLLAEMGYRVWAPNLRGYGNTSRPRRVADYSIEHLLDDVAGLIDASGAKETVLLAHDWGAVIAWLFAMRRCRPLHKLIICNVPHPAPMAREVRNNPRQRAKSWYVLFFQIPLLPQWLLRPTRVAQMLRATATNPENFTDADLETYRSSAALPGAMRAMVNYYRALVRGGGARRQAALGSPVIETPTLMLWGDNDMALEKATTYGTDQYVRTLTLRYLPGVSHWVQQDDPDTCNTMVSAFLLGQPVPHAPGAVGDSG